MKILITFLFSLFLRSPLTFIINGLTVWKSSWFEVVISDPECEDEEVEEMTAAIGSKFKLKNFLQLFLLLTFSYVNTYRQKGGDTRGEESK